MLKRIQINLHRNKGGVLGALEFKDFFSWEAKRFYFLHSCTEARGGHCVIGEKKVYICLKGSVVAKFFDGENWFEFNLTEENQAVLMEGDYWREFAEFSADCVLGVISSMNYEPEKYILELGKFQEFKLNGN
jgi:hypothetical protein